jgi:putative ABC transport system permease protein
MVRKASNKDILREIRKTASRFISIVLLLVLAVGFFSGLRVTQPDMRSTADAYMDAHGMYDIRVQSTLGLTGDDIAAVGKTEGVAGAAGFWQFDAVVATQSQDIVISAQTLGSSGMNSPELLSGRLPAGTGECAVEQRFLDQTGLKPGDAFSFTEVQSGFEDALMAKTFRIVGLVRSPLYISKIQRGTATLGSGSVAAYILLPEDAVTLDYYTEADITVTGALMETAYTGAYTDTVQAVLNRLTELGGTRASARRNDLVAGANDGPQASKTELEDKRAELEDSKKQLSDAKTDYAEGQKELEDRKAQAESELQKALDTLNSSEAQIEQNAGELDASQKQLDDRKAAGQAQLAATLADLDAKQSALNDALSAYGAAKAQYDAQLQEWNALPDSVRATMPDKAAQLEATARQLEAQKQQLDAQQAALTAGFKELDSQKAALEQQTAAAQQQLDAGRASLMKARARLDAGRREYESQKAEAGREIAEAEATLKDAEAKIADSENKITDGEKKIADAEAELRDAEQKIADIPEGKWYVEDRTSNIGYKNYGDDADRMGALGGIFPVIFFAVAALVCLTTMTRMVDEKRTEIGTYKALGHRGMTTAGKFVYYSLLSTVLGVAGGLAVG